mmetsp:Transcript_10415/g.15909  ORF Transcript_10415/g.15909 Transcript_10415/m.15909 type:complete len:192 (+) Transcript_10415:303-878(+)
MFEDEIDDEEGFEKCRAILENEKGPETHEYDLTICLVDGKSKDRRVWAEISVVFWIMGVNLMHFNQHSQDLAVFCRSLWDSSDRNPDHYSPMAIEFGESRYSGVEIRDLVEETTGEYAKNTLYISKAKLAPGSTSKESLELLSRLVDNIDASVIAYKTDLEKLSIGDDDDDDDIIFSSIQDGWFVLSREPG